MSQENSGWRSSTAFPYTQPDGTTIVDERCKCGCLRTQHGAHPASFVPGLGKCRECACRKYTWAAWVAKGGATWVAPR